MYMLYLFNFIILFKSNMLTFITFYSLVEHQMLMNARNAVAVGVMVAVAETLGVVMNASVRGTFCT